MGTRDRFRVVCAVLLALLVAGQSGVFAQAPPPAAPPAQGQGAAPPLLRPEELDQLLATIALYPDSLLTHVLMAATYPLEIVQGARWAKENASVKGDAVVAALGDKPWDPSVKSLAQFPDVLGMMSERLEWTQKLGDAFLNQQRDIVTSVQRLRKRAQEAGTLKSTPQQVVTVEKEIVVIQPANPQVIYVPSYDPVVVYGAWPYPAYPPYPPPPYYYPAAGVALGFAAVAITGAALYGSMNWHHGGDVTINNNVNRYNSGNINTGNINTGNINRGNVNTANVNTANVNKANVQAGTWKHDPAHRKGAPYSNPATAQRYGQTSSASGQFSGEARGYGSSRAQSGGQSGTAPARDAGGRPEASTRESGRPSGATPARETGSRPQASTRESGGGQTSAGGGADHGAFGGVGAGHSESVASQRGSMSRASSQSSVSAASSGRSGGGASRPAGGGGGGGRRR